MSCRHQTGGRCPTGWNLREPVWLQWASVMAASHPGSSTMRASEKGTLRVYRYYALLSYTGEVSQGGPSSVYSTFKLCTAKPKKGSHRKIQQIYKLEKLSVRRISWDPSKYIGIKVKCSTQRSYAFKICMGNKSFLQNLKASHAVEFKRFEDCNKDWQGSLWRRRHGNFGNNCLQVSSCWINLGKERRWPCIKLPTWQMSFMLCKPLHKVLLARWDFLMWMSVIFSIPILHPFLHILGLNTGGIIPCALVYCVYLRNIHTILCMLLFEELLPCGMGNLYVRNSNRIVHESLQGIPSHVDLLIFFCKVSSFLFAHCTSWAQFVAWSPAPEHNDLSVHNTLPFLYILEWKLFYTSWPTLSNCTTG